MFPSATVRVTDVSRVKLSLSPRLRVRLEGGVSLPPSSVIPERFWRRGDAVVTFPWGKPLPTFPATQPIPDVLQCPLHGADPCPQRVTEGFWCPAIGAEILPIIYPKGALTRNQADLPWETGVLQKMEDGQVASAWGSINTQGQVSG